MLKQKYITVILLVILIISLFINKKENFTESERKSALDGLITQNKLFNEVFSKISNSDLVISKKLIVNNNIETTGKDIKNGKITMGANGTIYTNSLNTNSIEKAGDINGANTINAKIINAKKINVEELNAKKICIGDTCINKTHLDVLTGKRHMIIANYEKNRFLKNNDKNSYKSEFHTKWQDERKRLYIYNINDEPAY